MLHNRTSGAPEEQLRERHDASDGRVNECISAENTQRATM
jgi:hypothetical protein